MKSRELCILLDDLRQTKKLSMESYIDGIVSLRQYKRYLYGTSEMPYKIFLKLSDRLGWNPMNILYELDQKKVSQLQRLDTFYNHVVSYQFDAASKLAEQLKKETFIDPTFETYFRIGLLLMEYWKSPTNPVSYATRCAELIDYPAILKNEVLNPIELLALSILMTFVQGSEKDDIISKLEQVITSSSFHFLGKDFYVVQFIHVKLAKEYGIRKQNEQVIKICLKAVEYAKLNYSYFNLDYLYYYLALAYRNIQDMEKAHQYLKKLVIDLEVQDNHEKKDKFEQLVTSDFILSFHQISQGQHSI